MSLFEEFKRRAVFRVAKLMLLAVKKMRPTSITCLAAPFVNHFAQRSMV